MNERKDTRHARKERLMDKRRKRLKKEGKEGLMDKWKGRLERNWRKAGRDGLEDG